MVVMLLHREMMPFSLAMKRGLMMEAKGTMVEEGTEMCPMISHRMKERRRCQVVVISTLDLLTRRRMVRRSILICGTRRLRSRKRTRRESARREFAENEKSCRLRWITIHLGRRHQEEAEKGKPVHLLLLVKADMPSKPN